MLHVQEYLKTHSLRQLEEEHGVYSSIKENYPSTHSHKFSLNYDQIEAKAGPLTNQCRGLILAMADGSVVSSLDTVIGDTVVLARPMDRFFNEGDGNAFKIDYDHSETRFLEKLDGTLCILYFDKFKNMWCVATRSVPEANLPLDGFGNMTFRQLFEKALTDNGVSSFEVFTSPLISDCTYCFELTSPYNRVVVDYKETKLTLLTTRDNVSGQEWAPYVSGGMFNIAGINNVQSYSLGSLKDLIEFVNSQNPTEHEGIVAVDKDFNRVKVKNAAYVAYNKARDAVGKSPRALLDLILLEKLDDVLPMLSDHLKEHALSMQEKVRALFHKVEHNYNHCKQVADQDTSGNARKAFCLEAQAQEFWLAPLIARFLGRCSNFHEYIHQHKNQLGEMPNSFLDGILRELDGL